MTQFSNGPGDSLRKTLESTSTGSPSFPKQVATQAKEIGSNAAAKAKEVATTRVERSAGKSAGQIDQVARALHDTSRQLGENSASPYIDKAANELDKVARYLRGATLPDIVKRVETFAHEDPVLFLGGAFVLGLAGARFLKSSARGAMPDDDIGSTLRPRDTDPLRPTAMEDRPYIPPAGKGFGG